MFPVTFDVETAKTEPGYQAPPLACIAYDGPDSSGLDSRTLFHTSDPWWVELFTTLLKCPDVLFVGHNIAYDFMVLANERPELFPLIWSAYASDRVTCTLVRQKLLDIASGDYRGFANGKKIAYSLEAVALRLLKRVLDKDTWRLHYGELIRVPLANWPEGAKTYPLEDVRATKDVFFTQEFKSELLADQYRQARASFWLRLLSAWGQRTDEAGIRALEQRTKIAYHEISKSLAECGLVRIEAKGKITRSIKAAQRRVAEVYTRLGKDIPKTKKEGVCTDKVVCEESGDPMLISYARLTSLQNVLGQDIPLLTAGTVRPIHVTVEELKATGRTGFKNPNTQNLKRHGGIRECFIAACLNCGEPVVVCGLLCKRCGMPASVMWSVDYGGAELATLAQACITILEKSRLADAINAGQDPHLMIAAQILGGTYEELKAIRAGHAGRFTKRVVDDARQVGKVCNFGFPGGLGAESLVFFALNNYGVRLTVDEAKHLKRLWLRQWPEMRQYFGWINSLSEKPSPQIEQLFVKRYRGAEGSRTYTSFCNTVFQGLSADIAKDAGFEISRACYDPSQGSVLLGSRIVNFVHDEFVGISYLTIAHECANEVKRLMIKSAKKYLTDVDISAEPALMYQFSKDACPVWKDGRLVPWVA